MIPFHRAPRTISIAAQWRTILTSQLVEPSGLRTVLLASQQQQHYQHHLHHSRTTPSARRHASSLAPVTPQDVRSSLQHPHYLTRKTAQQLQLPLFTACNDQLQLLESPAQFYQTLKEKIASAETRIFLASLYIGKEETELAEHLRSTLQSKRALRLTVLADALRSTRESSPQPSSASLLASLSRDFPDQVDLRLYHTPSLKGLTKRLVGKRFNEGWGLQHMKIYGFDDDVIVSGANLSRDYFTNRKDRYVVLSQHRQIANYLHSLVLLASRFSYHLVSTDAPSMPSPSEKEKADPYSNFTLEWDSGDRLLLGEEADGTVAEGGIVGPCSPARLPEQGWSSSAQSAVEAFTRRWHQHTLDTIQSSASSETEVCLVPLLQMGPLKIRQETIAIPQLFQLASAASASEGRPATLDLTSGYFSLYRPYKTLLSAPSQNEVQERTRIICAAPESNGFFQSRGVSGWIPDAYTWFEKKFYDALKRSGRLWTGGEGKGGVDMREWKKEGWTYHAKGIWYTPPDSPSPSMFHVGSSNYGARSSDLDLECTFLVSTSQGSPLSQRVKAEVEGLRADAQEVVGEKLFSRSDRKVRWRVIVAAWLVSGML